MKNLEELYPSVFKMIRAKAKTLTKVRFEKTVHISITNKLEENLMKFFKVCENQDNIDTSLFPKLKEKNREKIFKKDKKGRNHSNIIEMIRKDRAIIPLSKIKKITKWYCYYYNNKKVPISPQVYPIVQNFIESKIYDYTLKLLDIIENKKKKLIRSIYIHEIK